MMKFIHNDPLSTKDLSFATLLLREADSLQNACNIFYSTEMSAGLDKIDRSS